MTSMTTPYLTAIDGTQVSTAGPADPNAGARAKLYAGLAFLTPTLGALSAFNVITTDQAAGVSTWVSATLGLLGLFGFGLAASKTSKQVANGTFQPAPADVVGTVFDQLDQIKARVDDTVEHATTQAAAAADTIKNVTAAIPGAAVANAGVALLGRTVGDLFPDNGLAVLPGNVGDLIQGVADELGERH